ncbi:Amuc_1100 family pilus-like protein [Prosthecobacter sp.]|uniref:Amuc_1100 family pilus-like protein n=1 Tax=Prosthecobacter sp. TaxID=1965333 RepID=UPI001DE563BB|nr:Amuc_1100 family pilus-like protein [Prosthecobacter sp.]MCB1276664.1 Amuc_1100 family pilus-like protein [Prosthecobacter sp.]
MDWIRENKPLAAILGVIIAGSLALGYLVFDEWSNYSETKDGYLSMGSQVAALQGAPLAPTESNLKAKQALVDKYASMVNQLGGALLYLQPPVQAIKDIEFQAKLKTKIAEIRAEAASRMQLPSEFAFGFDDYTTGLPKSAAAAAELSSFLDAMDELVKLFLKCGVKSVDLLERSKLAVEQGQTSVQGNNTAGMQGRQQTAAGIYEKRQISVVLTLDQGPLQLLISRLANPSEMKYFTTLRLLRIENQHQEGPLRSDVKPPEALPTDGGAGTAEAASAESAAAASDVIKPPPAAPDDAVSVVGEEDLKVRLEIDLIKFLDAAKG